MSSSSDVEAPYLDLPTDRSDPFGPPDSLLSWQATEPIRRIDFHAGHRGWIVTSYDLSRAVLQDPRLSIKVGNAVGPGAVRLSEMEAPGVFARMDPPDHRRLRALVAGEFTPKSIEALHPRIERIVRERLDVLDEGRNPVDFVETFALPVPALVVCDMLGVPEGDRTEFRAHSETVLDKTLGHTERGVAAAAVFSYVAGLLRAKRRAPADDILSRLAGVEDATVEEAVGVASSLFIAGHVITASMLSLGLYTILSHPEQSRALHRDPELSDTAVDALLRFLTFATQPRIRVAMEDVEFGGVRVRKGELIAVSLGAANRDPSRFSAPEVFDISAASTGHLAFGWGIHRCLGQQLARAELRIAFGELFRRFPGIRLAGGDPDMGMGTNETVYSITRLPLDLERAAR